MRWQKQRKLLNPVNLNKCKRQNQASMMPRMQWLNIFTVKWLALTISLVFLLQSCGPKRPSDSLVGVPESPSESSSLDSLLQGLRYIREHPTQREDERVQRFLWIDQWASI